MTSISSVPEQALLIGITQYAHLPVLAATDDIAGMKKVLSDPRICAYPAQRVVAIEEESATRAAILAMLDELCVQASAPGSRTFFYFSGHGRRDKRGESYLATVDSHPDDLAHTAIAALDLAKRLDRCHGEVTVVLDCCYSAGLADAIGKAELADFGESLRAAMGRRNRVMFAAARPHGLAQIDTDASYGRLTLHLIEGLYGKASTDGLNVTVQQLFDYVSRQVFHRSSQAQQVSFIARTEHFYSLTRYPTPIPPNAVFEKDVYVAYDTYDDIVRDWVQGTFIPELKEAGCSVWNYDGLAYSKLDFEEAIIKSKYTVVVFTPGYLAGDVEALKTAQAILQAAHQRTPRFIPVIREPCRVPGAAGTIEGLDLSERNIRNRRRDMTRLINRLKAEPHVRVV